MNIQDIWAIYNTQLVQKNKIYIHPCTRYMSNENILSFHKTAGTEILDNYAFLKRFSFVILRICGGILFHIFQLHSMKMYPSYI